MQNLLESACGGLDSVDACGGLDSVDFWDSTEDADRLGGNLDGHRGKCAECRICLKVRVAVSTRGTSGIRRRTRLDVAAPWTSTEASLLRVEFA